MSDGKLDLASNTIGYRYYESDQLKAVIDKLKTMER
ncbi:MAG: hypothetical protein ACI81V_000879 [Lentimonas sp.]|jgi:hypothetical protein